MTFIRHLVTMDELEPKSMKKVLVWHSRRIASLRMEERLSQKGEMPSDVGVEV